MKIKTTFEFSDGTTITLTKEQVEELRAALAPAAPVLPPDTKPFPLDTQLYPLWQRPNFGPRLWDGTEWRGTPIPILCEATQ